MRMDEASHTRQTTRVHTSAQAAHQNHPRTPARPPLSHPDTSPPCLPAFTVTIKLAKLRTETLAKRRPWYHSVAWDPPCPQHWPPGRPPHDRQQFSTRASPDCTGVRRECVRMRSPTLDDACAHRADESRTRTAEESMRAAHLRQPTPLTSASARLHGHHQVGRVEG